MTKTKLQNSISEASADAEDLRLLLVDEDVNDLDYYAEVLRYLGYKVVPVDSYSRAAATLGRERFDLVIVDQGSTNFEGRSVLSRAVEVDRRVPVLVLTRAVDADCCLEALDAGAHEYVQKPLTTAEVRELVRDYVRTPVEKFPDSGPYEMPRNYASAGSSEAGDEPLRRAS
ncbi:MAG: response regulator [Acidobacteria bacterium]|nr:MAG: response regulator [Acidobacteriota bacterium]